MWTLNHHGMFSSNEITKKTHIQKAQRPTTGTYNSPTAMLHLFPKTNTVL